MPEYLVEWAIEIDADSPEDAARKALAIQRDPESIATTFHVTPEGVDDQHFIDLSAIDAGIIKGE
jgi:hypothetical protein